jgi:N,N'-diacetylchitobiose phosphorylase
MGKDHTAFGRAKHPFMTGSGGWSYFAATRYILGLRPDFDALVIDPCIPAAWKGFSANREWRGAFYEIEVVNTAGVSKGVKELLLNDAPISGVIPTQKAGSVNKIKVVMG